MTSTDELRAARDFLLAHRTDYAAARSGFEWPRPEHFNFALDWFDAVLAAERPHHPALRIIEAIPESFPRHPQEPRHLTRFHGALIPTSVRMVSPVSWRCGIGTREYRPPRKRDEVKGPALPRHLAGAIRLRQPAADRP